MWERKAPSPLQGTEQFSLVQLCDKISEGIDTSHEHVYATGWVFSNLNAWSPPTTRHTPQNTAECVKEVHEGYRGCTVAGVKPELHFEEV